MLSRARWFANGNSIHKPAYRPHRRPVPEAMEIDAMSMPGTTYRENMRPPGKSRLVYDKATRTIIKVATVSEDDSRISAIWRAEQVRHDLKMREQVKVSQVCWCANSIPRTSLNAIQSTSFT